MVQRAKIAVQPGMCIINTTGERHRIESAPDEHLRYFYLGFEFLDSAQNESAKVLRSFYENPPVRVVDDAFGIADAFVDLFNEILYQDSISNAMMESCMHRIIGGTYRLATHQHMRPYLFEHGDGENRNFVYDVIHYIDTHAHESALLSQLSTEFGYSYDYIARKFTHITGEKLRDYYHARRFEKARELLREGMSVTAVAERLGYESIHAFSNAFKKRVGLSPSDYRNQTVLKETEENDKK